jgi:hypothetical protein
MFTNKTTFFTSIILPVILITVLGLSLSSLFTISAPEKVNTRINYSSFTEAEIKGINSWKEQMSNKDLVFIDSGEFMQIYKENGKISSKFTGNDEIKQSIGMVYYKNLISIMASTNNFTSLENIRNYQYLNSVTKDNATTINGKNSMSAISYYSVTMIILTLAYGMMGAGELIERNIRSKIGLRIKLSGIKNKEVLNATIITNVLLLFTQITMIIAVLKIFFKDTVYNLSNFLIIVIGIVFFTLLGTYLGFKIKTLDKFKTTINLLVPFLVLISGGYYKIDFGMAKYLSPNYYLSSEIFNIYLGDTINVIFIIASFGIICLLYFLSLKQVRN